MAQSFAQLERKIEMVVKELDGGSMRDRLNRVGELSHGDVDSAVRGTLGDNSMSGWRRGAPIPIAGAHRVVGKTAVLISAGKSSGMMRVLQTGRNQGDSGGMAGPGVSADGSTKRNLDGSLKKVRKRKGYGIGKVGRRWNGTTQGKGTWDVAAANLDRNVPARVAREVHTVLGKYLNRG